MKQASSFRTAQVFFVATHAVEETDARIWAHWSRDLRRNYPSVSPWLLLFHDHHQVSGPAWSDVSRAALQRTGLEQALRICPLRLTHSRRLHPHATCPMPRAYPCPGSLAAEARDGSLCVVIEGRGSRLS